MTDGDESLPPVTSLCAPQREADYSTQLVRAPDAAQRKSGALLSRGPRGAEMGPGSADQRYTLHCVRDTS
jgi:hypothetical protein